MILNIKNQSKDLLQEKGIYNMGKIFFTSDLHLNHENIIRYCHRPFLNLEEMDKTLIDNFNATVSNDDTCYILGDFCLGDNADVASNFMNQLNGTKYLIRGNHDTDSKMNRYVENCKNLTVAGYVYMLKADNKHNFYVSHYPALVSNTTDGQYKKFLWNLHGHLHSKTAIWNSEIACYDVGVDAHNYKPVSLEEIISDISIFSEK
jgi:calcineurin-like phosphoesterase family protein